MSGAMTEYEAATLMTRYAAVAIGVGQLAVAWYGIRAMQRAGNRRAREQDQRHVETMTALRELISRTGRASD